jgi:hypothetical protein
LGFRLGSNSTRRYQYLIVWNVGPHGVELDEDFGPLFLLLDFGQAGSAVAEQKLPENEIGGGWFFDTIFQRPRSFFLVISRKLFRGYPIFTRIFSGKISAGKKCAKICLPSSIPSFNIICWDLLVKINGSFKYT